MFRNSILLFPAALLAGCISFNTSESPAVPDYAVFCQEKETQCTEICGSVGVQAFSCKITPGVGLDYQCQCKKAGVTL
jgi:hypothetical protein